MILFFSKDTNEKIHCGERKNTRHHGSAQGTQPNPNVMIFSQGETTPTLVPSPSSVRP
jgi:hypothetical protein